jgi:NAD+ synthase (glutamine-hydrolysing)
MRIGIAQLNPTIGDFSGNESQILSACAWAQREELACLITPELATTGYPPRDLLLRPSFLAAHEAMMTRICQQMPRDLVLILGCVGTNPAVIGPPLMNCAVALTNGARLHTQAKTLLPTYDVFDETRYFAPATQYGTVRVGAHTIGLSICEDAWFREEGAIGRYGVDPMGELRAAGADFVINIAASPFATGKDARRRRLIADTARTHDVPVCYVNMVGGNDQLVFDGGSLLANREGHIVWEGPRFSAGTFLCDTETLPQEGVASGPCALEGEVMSALTLGLRDYLRKCGFERVLVGVSGGIDSAVVAALAVEAIGAAHVAAVTMPSPFSSAESLADAHAVANSLHIDLREMPIERPYTQLRQSIGTSPSMDAPDLADENLQARIRGTILMTLSNREGALLLSTGNKSELAVGYCTLYGDMAGGLALISDVPKTMVYALARWMNREREVIPQGVIDRPPSAELRPDQVDQDVLPPYPVLDAILAAYIEGHQSIEEIIATGIDATIVHDVVQRVNRNEYKRCQAPPGIQISQRAFGIGRRFPIAAH